jgi:hypothetical protein
MYRPVPAVGGSVARVTIASVPSTSAAACATDASSVISENLEATDRAIVADLRRASARYPGDSG